MSTDDEKEFARIKGLCTNMMRQFVELIDFFEGPEPSDADERVEGMIDDMIDAFADEYEFVCVVASLLQSAVGLDHLREMIEEANVQRDTTLAEAKARLREAGRL